MESAERGLPVAERGKWLHELFTGMYFSDRLMEAKNSIEYRYDSHLAALLERRMNDRHVPIDEQDVMVLDNLDCFLNYIEHVLGMERLGLISADERRVVFDYWPNIIAGDENLAALRRYISMCGYELISEELGLENVDYLAVYGSLMSGLAPDHQPDFMGYLELVGEVLVPGTLYEVVGGSYRYPGLALTCEAEAKVLHPARRTVLGAERKAQRSASATVAELYRVKDATLFEAMDDWEAYDAAEPDSSPYVRRIIRMLEPSVDAWVYVGNHEDQTKAVQARSWRDHLTRMESGQDTGAPDVGVT